MEGEARYAGYDMEYEDGDFVGYAVKIVLPRHVNHDEADAWGRMLTGVATAINSECEQL